MALFKKKISLYEFYVAAISAALKVIDWNADDLAANDVKFENELKIIALAYISIIGEELNPINKVDVELSGFPQEFNRTSFEQALEYSMKGIAQGVFPGGKSNIVKHTQAYLDELEKTGSSMEEKYAAFTRVLIQKLPPEKKDLEHIGIYRPKVVSLIAKINIQLRHSILAKYKIV